MLAISSKLEASTLHLHLKRERRDDSVCARSGKPAARLAGEEIQEEIFVICCLSAVSECAEKTSNCRISVALLSEYIMVVCPFIWWFDLVPFVSPFGNGSIGNSELFE